MNDQASTRTLLYKNQKSWSDSSASFSDELNVSPKRPCHTSYRGSGPTCGSEIYSTDKPKKQKPETQRKNIDMTKVGTAALSQKTKMPTQAYNVEFSVKSKCYQCKDLVHRVRSLLDEIKDIRKNVPLDVCEFCKRKGKCKRCEYFQKKCQISVNIGDAARQQRFKTWLCKVKQLLFSILEREMCKHRVYPKSPMTDELAYLLRELRSPLTVREPAIGNFLSKEYLENITESKDILEEVLMKLKSEKRSEDLMMQSTCICKYFADKKFAEQQMEIELQRETLDTSNLQKSSSVTPVPLLSPKDITASAETKVFKQLKLPLSEKSQELKDLKKPIKESEPKSKTTNKDIKHPSPEKEPSSTKSPKKEPSSKSPKKEPSSSKSPKKERSSSKSPKKEESTTELEEEQLKKSKPSSTMLDMIRMMRVNMKAREVKKKPQAKVPKLPKIKELPLVQMKELKEISTPSGSFAECDVSDGEPTEMVKGKRIVPIEPRLELGSGSVQPLLFKTAPVCPEPKIETPKSEPAITTHTKSSATHSSKSKKSEKDDDNKSTGKGILRYMLSNREFIEKGWTMLPTTKIMRRMNIYKMKPACPQFDWFERNKDKKFLFYSTGEKLAEIQEDGSGLLFYKTGHVALAHYCPAETNSHFRYVVYSSGVNKDGGRKLPVTVLASFDYQGNGVVYDHYGNERLKYNQSEGMVFDDKIGPPGRWLWHKLNEPPALQPVCFEHREKPTPCLERVLRRHKDDDVGKKKEPHLEMLAVELDHFVKEKARALLQEFKPFQIKMKALRLNDQFSLKVLDQANISLMFRDSPTSIKLNLGMILVSDEIIDTTTSKAAEVVTPYDEIPAKSESIADIQVAIEKARKLGKVRGKLRN